MGSSKLSVVTGTSCTNESNLPLELTNSTKVSSDFRLAFFPQFSRCSNVSPGNSQNCLYGDVIKMASLLESRCYGPFSSVAF